MDALAVDDGVRTCEVDVLEDAAGLLLVRRERIRLETVLVDDDHLTRQDIAHELSADDIEAASLRREDPAALLCFADAERTEPLRIAGADELLLRHDGQAIAALDHLEALDDALLDRLLVGARDKVHNDFRIDGRLEDRALLLEVMADLSGIRQIAVVGKRDLAARIVDEQRLRVSEQARARRRIAHMADGNALILHVRDLMAEYFIDEAHAARHIHPGAIRDGDAGTLLPAMLQGVEAEIRQTGDIFRMGVHAVNAAFLFPLRFWVVAIIIHGCSASSFSLDDTFSYQRDLMEPEGR